MKQLTLQSVFKQLSINFVGSVFSSR